MKFKALLDRASELKREQQDLQSTAYVVFPVADNFRFISFFDIEQLAMGYTVVDQNFVEVKMLSELPAEILVAFGKFVETIEMWQKDESMEFPYSMYAGNNIDETQIKSKFEFVPPDQDLDGDEAKLT